MAGTATILPLQEYIASLDKTCLPKIVQVCSGVYFQGRHFSFNIFIVNWNGEVKDPLLYIVTCLHCIHVVFFVA